MDGLNKADLNLLAAYPIMHRKYNITMSETDFIEEAYIAFKEINSIPVKYYYYTAKPLSIDNMSVKLPCNVYRILSVTSAPLNGDDYRDIEPYKAPLSQPKDRKELTQNILIGNSDLQTYQLNDTPYVGLGTYLAYEWGSDEHIIIADTRLVDSDIHIVYEGIAVDEEGLPMITRKHAQAIAVKVAYTYAIRKVFMGDPTMTQILPLLTQEAARLTQAAAIPEHITDNELDNMLNEHTRFDRKRYNKGFKFRR